MEKKTETWFDKHSQALMILLDIAIEIESLARGFKITGNEIMHKSLMTFAQEIEIATKDIGDAIGESISENIDRSARSTENVLKAALTSIALTNKKK